MNILMYLFIIFIVVVAIYTVITINTDELAIRGAKYEQKASEAISSVLGVKVHRNIIFNYASVRRGSNLTKDEMVAMYLKETEVDMAFVSSKGIFCIECKSRKNKNDELFGSLNHPTWTLPFDEIQNPFDQNYKHIKTIYENVVNIDKKCVFNIVITNAGFTFVRNGLDVNSKDNPYVDMLGGEMAALIRYRNDKKGLKQFKKAVDNLPDILSADEVRRFDECLAKNEGTKKMVKDHADHMIYLRSMDIF